MLLARLIALAALLPLAALAQRQTSQDALARLEETLGARMEDGAFAAKELTPAIVVSVTPAFEETRAWYPTAALGALVHLFGDSALRSCEACMAPRLYVEEGRLEHQAPTPDTEAILRLDQSTRGTAAPARSAIWLDETPGGVSLRIVDLHNGRIVYAQNFDPSLKEMTRTHRNFTLTRELERRARGDSLSHTFMDFALYPGQHVSLDFAEQWGETNHQISGVVLSLYDPVLGVGAGYYRVVPRALNMMVGGKVLLSVPTAVVEGVTGESAPNLDPLLTAVFLVRLPIASSNYGVVLSASLPKFNVGVGISLMNISFYPMLP